MTHTARPGWGRRISAAGAVLATLAAAGCGSMGNLAFTQDHRLAITAPEHRAHIDRPVTLRWQITDFRIAAPSSEPPSRSAGYFALFVDRSPVPPGETTDIVAEGDPECARTPGCPDKRYFAERGIYTTTQNQLTLASVPDLGTHEPNELHTVTIVLLDTEGDRIGESAWYVEFWLPNRDER